MPHRTKLLVVAVVVALGVSAAFIFRKSTSPETETPSSVAGDAGTRETFSSPPEKPAPASHLTGRIDPPEKAIDIPPPPDARRGDGAGFGLSAIPPGGGAYSSLRPSGEDSGTGSLAAGAPLPGVSYSELRRHKVADGDTLSGLALKYLGTADRYREIYELNRETLANPDLLPIGAELKIPAAGSPIAPPRDTDSRPMVPVAPRGTSVPAPSEGAASGTHPARTSLMPADTAQVA